jgi:hypothetical protein
MVAVGAPPAAADTMITTCGQTVTTDAQLAFDLSCASGNGLVVGVDGITIDLAGHTLSGTTSGNGVEITNRSNITVRNGTITGWATGVRAVVGSNIAVQDLDITVPSSGPTSGVAFGATSSASVVNTVIHDGGIGVLVDGASGSTVQGNHFDAPQQAVLVSGANDTLVTQNEANGSASGVAIGTGSTGTTITDNVLRTGVAGIYVDPSANTGTVIRANTATDYASDGIFIDAGTSTTLLEGNLVERNHTGITVRTATTTITANRAFDNAALGIDAVAGVTDGGGNEAAGNGDPRQCVGVVCTDPSLGAPFPGTAGPAPIPLTPAAGLLATPRFTG